MADTRDEAIAEREADLNYERWAFDPLTAAEQAAYDEGYEAGADSVEGDQPPASADDPYGAGWREGNAARRKLSSARADQVEAEIDAGLGLLGEIPEPLSWVQRQEFGAVDVARWRFPGGHWLSYLHTDGRHATVARNADGWRVSTDRVPAKYLRSEQVTEFRSAVEIARAWVGLPEPVRRSLPDYIAQAAAKRADFDARYAEARADREARQEASGLEISVTVFERDTHPSWALDRVERGLGL